MTFSFTMSPSDLLLLLPEICSRPCYVSSSSLISRSRLHNEQLAYSPSAGLVATLGPAWSISPASPGPSRKTCSPSTGWPCSSNVHSLESTILVILASIDTSIDSSSSAENIISDSNVGPRNDVLWLRETTLLSVFVRLEISTIGFYVLVCLSPRDLASNEAGIKFFILGIFAAGLLAYGISLVYGETGKLVFSDMKAAQATPGLAIGFC